MRVLANRFAIVALFALSAFELSAQQSSGDLRIEVPNQPVQVYETIEVRVTGLPGNKQDWITFVGANEADTKFGQWAYTEGVKDGTWTFKSARPGNYEVRVYFDYPTGGYTVHARVPIQVVTEKAAAASPPKTTVAPSQTGAVAPALQGMVAPAPQSMVAPAPQGMAISAPGGAAQKPPAPTSVAKKADTQQSAAKAGGGSTAIGSSKPRSAHDRILVPILVYEGRDREGILSDAEAKTLTDYFELVRLRANPHIGRVPAGRSMAGFAQTPVCLAQTHMSEAEQDEILAPVTARLPTRQWKGAGRDEFEMQRAKELYGSKLYPALIERTPTLPLKVVFVTYVNLAAYDQQRGGFPIMRMPQSWGNRGATTIALPVPGCFHFEADYIPFGTLLPEFWEIDSAQAQSLVVARIPTEGGFGNTSGATRRKVYVGIDATLSTAPLVKFDQKKHQIKGNVPLTIDVESVALYEDPDLERHLGTLPLDKPAPAVLVADLPDKVSSADPLLLDDNGVALLLLAQQGDIMSTAAWNALARYQSLKDRDYYIKLKQSSYALTGHTEHLASFDPEHVPFFPKGNELKFNQSLASEQLVLFKSFSQMRANALPERLFLRGQLFRQTNLVEDFTLSLDNAVSPGRPVLEMLAERGYAKEQVLVLNPNMAFQYLPQGSPQRTILVFPRAIEQYDTGVSPGTLNERAGREGRSWPMDLTVTVEHTELLRDVANADATGRVAADLFLVHLKPTELTVLVRDAADQRNQVYRMRTIYEHSYD